MHLTRREWLTAARAALRNVPWPELETKIKEAEAMTDEAWETQKNEFDTDKVGTTSWGAK